MTVKMQSEQGATAVPESNLYVGRFVRRQGQYGTVAVVGRLNGRNIDLIADPKRLFPRDGLVETHGVSDHAVSGEWVEFDVVKNSRPRAPKYKVVRLRKLPRYAVLPEATLAGYRTLLTNEGWRGDRRSGLWALKVSGDKVLVVELALGKDGALRIPRSAAREVRWFKYSDDLIVRINVDEVPEGVLLIDPGRPSGSFDWSDEADHVARVVRSLSGANDPRIDDIITWLDLHHEEGTGRVFVATQDHDAALAALRSGELAERLRADRTLMRAYLDAVLQDATVRDTVAVYAREGQGAVRAELREELDQELSAEKASRMSKLAIEIERHKTKALETIEREAAELHEKQRRKAEHRERQAEEELAARIKVFDGEVESRKVSLNREIANQESVLAETKATSKAAADNLENIRTETEDARAQLRAIAAEIDRLLAIQKRIGTPETRPPTEPSLSIRGVGQLFPDRPMVPVGNKGRIVADQVLLTEKGKDLLRRLMVLLLSGELPILIGDESADFLQLAGALICPGRFASMEADPTLISVDDLWSRPGSGAPTTMALAADAAGRGGGAVLVAVRGIERSGARFWIPALADCLRDGSLPRGLLVCCVVSERGHDEVEALPGDLPWLELSGAFAEGAYATALTLLTSPKLDLSALDPGPMPSDFSQATQMVLELGFEPSLSQAMRIARMFAEAKALLGGDAEAKRIVIDLANSIAGQAAQLKMGGVDA